MHPVPDYILSVEAKMCLKKCQKDLLAGMVMESKSAVIDTADTTNRMKLFR